MTHVTHKQEDLKVASSCRVELRGRGEKKQKWLPSQRGGTNVPPKYTPLVSKVLGRGGLSCCLALVC